MWKSFNLSSEQKSGLRRKLENMPEVFSFAEEGVMAGCLASLGIHQELSTINDELTEFLFLESGEKCELEDMRSELVQWKGQVGVRIWHKSMGRLFLSHSDLEYLLHPEFSYEDGELRQLFVFPTLIAQMLFLEDVSVVIYKEWAKNTVFNRFGHSRGYYNLNHWELANNDGLRMAELLEKRQIVFLGTHDLTRHIGGIRSDWWDELEKVGADARREIVSFMNGIEAEKAPTSSLLLPYLVGVFLDQVAQTSLYNSQIHVEAIYELLRELNRFPVNRKTQLVRFPERFVGLIEFVNSGGEREQLPKRVRGLVNEIASVTVSH